MEESTKEQILKKYLENDIILNEMVNCIRGHDLNVKLVNEEFPRGAMIRYLSCPNLNILKKIITRFELIRKPRNYYISCAYVYRVPFITWNLGKNKTTGLERKETPEYVEFDKNYVSKYAFKYDFLWDFDSHDCPFETCYNETKQFKELLDLKKIPYWINCSSNLGFHVLIPASYMPPRTELKELIGQMNDVLYATAKREMFESIDIEYPMDEKKLRKLEYSPLISGFVVYPLSDEDFNNFNEDNVRIEAILKNVEKLKGRGKLIRTHGLTDIELKKNVLDFFNTKRNISS